MPPRIRRPRGHIEELASGSFRVVVYAGIDPLTRRERRLKGDDQDVRRGEGRADQASGPGRRREASEDQHHRLASDRPMARRREARGDDARSVRHLIRIYIRPTFGDLSAGKLDAEILERFYGRVQRCRVLCDGRARRGHKCRPLSGSTVRQIHHIISGALERAVRWRHLGINKASFAVPPSPNRPDPDPRARRKPHACSTPHGRTRTGACCCG
jgi:integrase